MLSLFFTGKRVDESDDVRYYYEMSSEYAQEVSAVYMAQGAKGFGEARQIAAELDELGLQVPHVVTPAMVALAGAANGCVSTIHHAEQAGRAGAASVYESYIRRNAFNRAIGRHLPPAARQSWRQPIRREIGNPGDEAIYPQGVNPDYVYGAAKPARAMPANTVYYLATIGVREVGITVPWKVFFEPIQAAQNEVEVASIIGATIANELTGKWIPPAGVANVLRKGYNHQRLEAEYGYVEQIDEVHTSLRAALEEQPATKPVAVLLGEALEIPKPLPSPDVASQD